MWHKPTLCAGHACVRNSVRHVCTCMCMQRACACSVHVHTACMCLCMQQARREKGASSQPPLRIPQFNFSLTSPVYVPTPFQHPMHPKKKPITPTPHPLPPRHPTRTSGPTAPPHPSAPAPASPDAQAPPRWGGSPLHPLDTLSTPFHTPPHLRLRLQPREHLHAGADRLQVLCHLLARAPAPRLRTQRGSRVAQRLGFKG